ncbi:hypothetical protein PDESU_03866 [Pontiella desulfatans]|uniref:Uncharacterized protein n=1 Tax=Pontiella desulfatans TaxID=2750659 RepID=A0A6C2U783_PONDE|nr:hypothetical protein PDESU_03866 [Pontiella desulfatans]
MNQILKKKITDQKNPSKYQKTENLRLTYMGLEEVVYFGFFHRLEELG